MPSFSSVRRAGQGDCSTSRMISVLSDAEYLMPRLPHPRSCFMEWPAPPSGDVRSPAFSGGGMGMTMRMRISVLGVDLGKNVCSLGGLDASGAVVLRRRAKRQTLIALAAKLPPCVVAMEACCGAHHLGRVFAGHPHRRDHRQPIAESGGKGEAASRSEKNAVGYDAGKKVKGNKIHALVDVEGLPLHVIVHPAGIQDRGGAVLVLDK